MSWSGRRGGRRSSGAAREQNGAGRRLIETQSSAKDGKKDVTDEDACRAAGDCLVSNFFLQWDERTCRLTLV